MALTSSNPFPLGKIAPSFELLNVVSGNYQDLNELKGDKGVAIFFICNHCPFVIHINNELIKIANNYKEFGVNCVAISSNDIQSYPQDAPLKMKELAIQLGFPFPYLYDNTQSVAKDYDAACTPDLYLFDSDLKCVYHGQLDGSRPGNSIEVTGSDLRHAIDCLIKDEENTKDQSPSIGCGIKWI